MIKLIDNLHPTYCLSSVKELSPEALQRIIPNLMGVTWDLDKTLIDQHEKVVPSEHIAVLKFIKDLGLKQGILSNASSQERTKRVHTIAADIANLIGDDIYVVTSRMVRGKKKPFKPVFKLMSEAMSIPPQNLCYVGDQLIKDVFGANRSGFGGSVLVSPYGEGDDPLVKYLQRPLEALIRPVIGLPFLSKNFGK